jgi:hypothetical protein
MESNYLHGKLGSKKPMKPKPYRLDKLPSGGGGSTIPGNTGNQANQEIKNLERDIEVLNRKYSDLTNIPLENSRNIHLPIIPGAKPQDEKSKLFDELLTRIISLDREVLRMTSEDMPRLVRRNSKPSADSLGNDLIHLPTHLILLDRLMDFHTLLKRENALKEGRGGSQGGMRGDVNPSSSPQVFTLLAENESLKKQLEEVTKASLSRYSHLQRAHDKLTQELLQLQQSALQSSVDLDSHIQQSLNEKSVRESLRKEFEDERQIWRNREASLAEEVQELKTQKDVLKQNYLQKEREWQQRQEKEELMEQKWSKEREKLEEELERQRQREQQQLLTSDGQYTDEATKEIFLLKREVQQLKEKCQRREEEEESLRQCRRAVAEALRLIHDSQLSPSHRDGEDQRLQQEQPEEQKEVGEDDKESYQVTSPHSFFPFLTSSVPALLLLFFLESSSTPQLPAVSVSSAAVSSCLFTALSRTDASTTDVTPRVSPIRTRHSSRPVLTSPTTRAAPQTTA